ncbi:MAG: hypothetical protein MRJ92_01850 [Nitrospira sp.]|nr:hypothetical protein [Nitrospira sp.]
MTQLTTIATTLLLAAFALPVAADTGTTLNQVIKDGTARYCDDPQELLTLAAGFWAQAGSDVTATIHPPTGLLCGQEPAGREGQAIHLQRRSAPLWSPAVCQEFTHQGPGRIGMGGLQRPRLPQG